VYEYQIDLAIKNLFAPSPDHDRLRALQFSQQDKLWWLECRIYFIFSEFFKVRNISPGTRFVQRALGFRVAGITR